jgi:hypothetical protein
MKGLAVVAACGALATPVNAACWSSAAYRAAQVRELDTMMMVEALRCRRTDANFLPAYNEFVRTSRAALIKANDELRAQFATTVGTARALGAYDDYMTTVANRYGAGTAGIDCGDMASIAAAAAAANGSGEALAALAERADMRPNLPGARCERDLPAPTFAARQR